MYSKLTTSVLAHYKGLSEDESTVVTKRYFNENYGFRDIPVVFRRAFQEWEIKNKWYPTYLDDALGYKEFGLTSRDGSKAYNISISSYMNFIEDEERPKLDHLVENLGFDHPLRADYHTPECFDCWYQTDGSAKFAHTFLYAGGAGTFTDTHLDKWSSSAWNYLISGAKLWFIFPERFNATIAANLGQYQLDALVRNALAGRTISARPLVCLQRAGDLVFTPGNCWHAVYNVAPSLALTDNFINETNYEVARKYFANNLGEAPQSSLNKLIARGFHNLQHATS